MKNVYLLSGPNKREGFISELSSYMKTDFNNAKKLVAISANPEKHEKNDKYIYGSDDSLGLIKMLSKAGVNIEECIVLDTRIDAEIGIVAIKNADIIHLMGGDPLDQFDFIKKYNYDKYIQESEAGIIGTSAGAMNLAENVYCPKYEKVEQAYFYKGLGLTKVTIEPHFDINNNDQVLEITRMSKINKIIGLPNPSAIIIKNADITFVGDYYVYDEKS